MDFGSIPLARRVGLRVGTRFSDAVAVMRGTPRRQLIFLHVPKTGGTTVFHYISACIGSKKSPRVAKLSELQPGTTCHPTDIETARRARFVYGHISWSAVEKIKQDNAFVFTFLRDPGDRLSSLYYFLRDVPMHTVGWRNKDIYSLAKKLTPHKFFTSDDEKIRHFMDNWIVRQLTGHLNTLPESQVERRALLERAKKNLSRIDHVSFQDSLDHDLPYIVKSAGLPWIGGPAPRIKTWTNITSTFGDGQQKREVFDARTRAVIEPLIELDQALFEWAVNRFRQQQPDKQTAAAVVPALAQASAKAA